MHKYIQKRLDLLCVSVVYAVTDHSAAHSLWARNDVRAGSRDIDD